MHEQRPAPVSDADDPAAMTGSSAVDVLDASADDASLRDTVERAYGFRVVAPRSALMPALLPVRRQHMTARPLQRGFLRQVLGMFVYRPAARVLRTFQVLTGRVERV